MENLLDSNVLKTIRALVLEDSVRERGLDVVIDLLEQYKSHVDECLFIANNFDEIQRIKKERCLEKK